MTSPLTKTRFEAAFNRSRGAIGSEDEQDPRVQELWTMLEPVLEERGRFDAEVRVHYTNVSNHLAECTKDLVSWRESRAFAVAFAVAIVVLIVALLGIAIFWPGSKISIQNIGDDSVRIAFIGGCFAILFGLPALILKGAFTSTKKDESEGLMPEGTKVLAQSLIDIVKTGK